jgi:hypothetical protein
MGRRKMMKTTSKVYAWGIISSFGRRTRSGLNPMVMLFVGALSPSFSGYGLYILCKAFISLCWINKVESASLRSFFWKKEAVTVCAAIYLPNQFYVSSFICGITFMYDRTRIIYTSSTKFHVLDILSWYCHPSVCILSACDTVDHSRLVLAVGRQFKRPSFFS